MKAIAHTFISVVMALLLLASTIPWTVGKHKCLGRVVDVALFADAEDCGMGLAFLGDKAPQKHCCDDEHITIQGQDDLKLNYNDVELVTYPMAFDVWADGFEHWSTELDTERTKLPRHPPPQHAKDLLILYGVFLI